MSSWTPTGNLTKGLEEEVFIGTPEGFPLGLSHLLAARHAGYTCEPDARLVEYTTKPTASYDQLRRSVLTQRRQLRQHLTGLGARTMIPGATLSLGDSQSFFRAAPCDPYHSYIERTYGTRVVTTSAHLNIGLQDPALFLRCYRLVRMEACLFLALSAGSPFLDGSCTGFHSTRWHLFPETPAQVPLFASHEHYARWIEQQLACGAMYNIRHLWLSVRPNGKLAPRQLERLELRICDRLDDPALLSALFALLEARLWQAIEDPDLDPLTQARPAGADPSTWLVGLAAENEATCSRRSLDGQIRHWRDGQTLSVRAWIEQLLEEALPTARAHGLAEELGPLQRLLEQGNTAQRWLHLHRRGWSVQRIIQQAIEELAAFEQENELYLENEVTALRTDHPLAGIEQEQPSCACSSTCCTR